MTGPTETDLAVARRSRRVAIALVGGAVVFMLGEFLGAAYDVPGRWMGLFELAVLAVMAWAIYESVTLWRMRRTKE